VVWGKIIGAAAGFAMGGPLGAMAGAALGHAAETGLPGQNANPFAGAQSLSREQVFSIAVVVLAAKLAKVDGPVNRAEIAAFRQHFHVPPQAARDVGQLFDQARDSPEGFEGYAIHLGEAFADNRGLLEDVLAALFAIARADRPVNGYEQQFLSAVWRGFGLDEAAWRRAAGHAPRTQPGEDDPYEVLGVAPGTGDEALRATWKNLMRENHPDLLAARGVPEEFIARANEKVARINAAWDRIKRERGL
jgi:DnaJ like chaperone protein